MRPSTLSVFVLLVLSVSSTFAAEFTGQLLVYCETKGVMTANVATFSDGRLTLKSVDADTGEVKITHLTSKDQCTIEVEKQVGI